jgi:diphthamide biosynthesis protein 2
MGNAFFSLSKAKEGLIARICFAYYERAQYSKLGKILAQTLPDCPFCKPPQGLKLPMLICQITPLLSEHPHIKRIALQFPDQLLPRSVEIYQVLQAENPSLSFFILADTSFGNCCVDEVAAEHVSADLLIHFGAACFSPPSSLAVWWVVNEISLVEPVDVAFEGQVVVMSDFEILNFNEIAKDNWIEAKIVDRFTPQLNSISLNEAKFNASNTLFRECTSLYGRMVKNTFDSEEAYCILFVGQANSSTYAHLMLTEAASKGIQVFLLEVPIKINTHSLLEEPFLVKSTTISSFNSSRPFVKRLRCIEAIKPAQIFGLLLGTASTRGTLETLAKVKRILQAAGKHHYTFYLGKLNAPKLGNFLEIDAFVWIGCPQARLIYDSEFYAEFHRPVVTPIELAICLQQNGEPFGGMKYCLDFEGFLKEQELVEQQETHSNQTTQITPLDLTNRKMALVASKKQFQGLAYEVEEQQKQQTEIQEGRTGIACGYSHEKLSSRSS